MRLSSKIILLSLIGICVKSPAQINNHLQSITKNISKQKVYSKTTDLQGNLSTQYLMAVELYDLSTIEDLTFIVKTTRSPLVKLYALLILKRKNFSEAKKLFEDLNLDSDQTKLAYQNGCYRSYEYLKALFWSEFFLLEKDVKK